MRTYVQNDSLSSYDTLCPMCPLTSQMNHIVTCKASRASEMEDSVGPVDLIYLYDVTLMTCAVKHACHALFLSYLS